jgi:hypothetical protein
MVMFWGAAEQREFFVQALTGQWLLCYICEQLAHT